MRYADISSCKHQIVNIHGIEAAIRNSKGGGAVVISSRLSVMVEACGGVIVDLPAAVSDHIIELSARLHVFLGQYMSANVPSAFAFSGQEACPFKLPVFCVMVARILYMIPHAERKLE